jgi:hypothetical protein
MNGDYGVTSEPYRLMPPRKRTRSDLGEALGAVRATGSLREALDAAGGTAPDPADPAGDFAWPNAAPLRERQWPRRLGRTMARVDVWLLIMAIITVVVTYLAWMKPH